MKLLQALFLVYSVGFGIAALVTMAMKTFDSPGLGKISLIYPTLSNPYFVRSVNNTVISQVSDKLGEINQDFLGFGYFIVFVAVLWLRAFTLSCPSAISICRPHDWSNPLKSGKKKSIVEEADEEFEAKIESRSPDTREYIYEHLNSYMSIYRPLYRPILMSLMLVLCGVTDPFIFARVMLISASIEIVPFFLQRTFLNVLFYLLVNLAHWGLFIWASSRFPSKLVLATACLGIAETTVHALSIKLEDPDWSGVYRQVRWMDQTVEIVFHCVLLASCFNGNFYV